MNISIILPSRNNLKYLKWSYAAIRKHQGRHTVQVCVADDFSDDGTWEWCAEIKEKDPDFDCIRNNGPTRVGHTILYDRLVNEVAKYDMCMIYHADMYLCPGALDAIEGLMYEPDQNTSIPIGSVTDEDGNHLFFERGKLLKPVQKRIVSLTRIEPPLHPPGPEKFLMDFGTEPETFNESGLLSWVSEPSRYGSLTDGHTTEGIFAPWAFWKSDFQEIGGHDPLFAPQSKEDSDIFNRFQLNGVEFVQTWDGVVYHMTCRGSRFNPTLTSVGTNSPEWEAQNVRSARNFIRKWGHYVKHDKYMKPIIPHKYDIAFYLYGGAGGAIGHFEPWCTTLYTTLPETHIEQYFLMEQQNTRYDLRERVKSGIPSKMLHDVTVLIRLDIQGMFTEADMQYIQMLPELLADSGVPHSTMTIGNLEIHTNELVPIESGLIHLNK